jgi:hypothetical protein
VPIRASHLHLACRGFVLGAFALLERADVPLKLERRGSLVELRPQVRTVVEATAWELRRREDTTLALEELARLPEARVFTTAEAGPFRTALLPLLVETAERCAGLDWHDDAFEAAYERLEETIFEPPRRLCALAPLVGISTPFCVDLRDAVRVRPAVDGELEEHWAEAQRLLPRDFGREVDRYCVLEIAGEIDEPRPLAPVVARVVAALREATGAPAAAPSVLVWLDGKPYAAERTPAQAAFQPAGEPTRLDRFRAARAGELLASAPAKVAA